MSIPYKEGTRFHFMKLTWFACCGFIRVIDERDGFDHRGRGRTHERDINLCDWLERAKALYEETRDRAGSTMPYAEKMKLVRMAQGVEESCQQAAEMGSPFDVEVQKYRGRHKEFRRSMVLAGLASQRMEVVGEGNSSLLIPELALL